MLLFMVYLLQELVYMKKKNKPITSLILCIGVLVQLVTSSSFRTSISNAKANIDNISNKRDEAKKIVSNSDTLKVYITDVGQADSILIRDGNYNMLIDAGNNSDGEKIVKYYKELGITSFKYVFASHPHEDHIGGMDDIINNFDIENFYMPDKLSTTKTFEDMLDALERKNLKYIVPKVNDKLSLNNSNIDVICVGSDESDINDSSIVLKLNYFSNSFLFTGDLGSNKEKEILNSGANIKADVLKVGHHGSSYSTASLFLDKVNPSFAAISVGKNNIYKHPATSTLEKLNKKGIKVYRTDLDGTILFESNGKDISVSTFDTLTNG